MALPVKNWANARAIFILFVLMPAAGCRSNEKQLPAVEANLTGTSVSGLSAGGYMASQFLVAHSSTVIGGGILAAGPFGCAQSAAAQAFPSFEAALPYNLAQAQNGCMADRLSGLGVLDAQRLLRLAASLADKGKIDPLSGLRRSKIYFYTSADDNIVVKAVVEAARNFFLAAGVPETQIEFVNKDPGGHAFLTASQGGACGTNSGPYVDNCHYDQAEAVLSFIYGKLLPKGHAQTQNFITFAQSSYASSNASLAEEGVVYIPTGCREKAHCRVHVVFHGCQQSRADVGDAVIRETGYADWAETNNIIVLFPQAAATAVNPYGCWDWWGYTGSDYLTKDAPQIVAVEAMLTRLGEQQ